MPIRLAATLVLACGIVMQAAAALAQGPVIATVRWTLFPYCDTLDADVRFVSDGVFRLDVKHDNCGREGFIHAGTARPLPDGNYRIEFFTSFRDPTLWATISPMTLIGTWDFDGESGSLRVGAAGVATAGPRLMTRGNAALGGFALASGARFAQNNSALGYQALRDLLPISRGTGSVGNEANTAVGAESGRRLTKGYQNVLVGAQAGANLVDGYQNLYFGFAGSDQDAALATESQTIRIGEHRTHTRAFLAGVNGVTTALNDAVPVVVDGNGQLGTVVSTARAKDDIAQLSTASTLVQRLRPVQFRYRRPFADGSRPLQYGLIAEEVEAVAPELVAHDADGRPATVKYHVLPALLLAEVQRLERERASLTEELAALRAFVVERLGQMPVSRPVPRN